MQQCYKLQYSIRQKLKHTYTHTYTHTCVTSEYLLLECLGVVKRFAPPPRLDWLWAPAGCLSDRHRTSFNQGCGANPVNSNTRQTKEVKNVRNHTSTLFMHINCVHLKKRFKAAPNVTLSKRIHGIMSVNSLRVLLYSNCLFW